MRIGIIGNSHLAALKFGLRQHVQVPDLEVNFWGMPGRLFPDTVKIYGTKLTGLPKISADERLSIDDVEIFDAMNMDAVVIYAQSVRLEDVVWPLNDLEKSVVSKTFRLAFLKDLAENKFAFQFASQLAGLPVRTIIHAAPLFSETSPCPDIEIGPAVDFLSRVAEKCGATFITQPHETISAGGKTKSSYSTANIHLDGKERKDDYKHMNADFGEAVMANLLNILNI